MGGGVVEPRTVRVERYDDIGLVLSSRLEEWSDVYNYGSEGTREQAVDVLRAVLEFQDPTVVAVFASWCMAVLLKGQVMERTSMFPVMALEAPSESGKTTGFFALMLQLIGCRVGAAQMTRASMRDALSVNRSGVVWIDDVSDPVRWEETLELLRHTTAEGVATKKGQDRTSQESVRLVGCAVVSSESMAALHEEKAMADRCIVLKVGNPRERRSVSGSGELQWADIVALRREWGDDLTQLAGWLVESALRWSGWVDQLEQLRPQGENADGGSVGGRWSDKIAILRMGARVLQSVVNEGTVDDAGIGNRWVELVDQWCGVQEDDGDENLLTRRILVDYLAWKRGGWASSARGGPEVYVDQEGSVWVHVQSLARWWAQQSRGAGSGRERQLGAAEAIVMQLEQMGVDKRGIRKWTDGVSKKRQMRYHQLPPEISRRVLRRVGIGVTQKGDTGGDTGDTEGISGELAFDKPELASEEATTTGRESE